MVIGVKVKLDDVCDRATSNLKQADILNKTGDYPVYGASGYISLKPQAAHLQRVPNCLEMRIATPRMT